MATDLAETTMENIRSTSFDNLTVNANPTPVSTNLLAGGQVKTYIELYQNNPKIKQVTVKVYWSNRPEAQAITLTTLVTAGGLNG